MRWSPKAAVACGMLALAACARPPPPAPLRRADLTLKLSTMTLGNGLRVVLVPDSEAPEVQVTMRYRVGGVNDPPDQAGMAHLVEHLMFEQVLGSRSLFTRLGDVATFFNAFTSLDATTYIARADVAHLGELLSIEAVRLGFRCTTIDESAFVREREVVLNEVALRDHATAVLGAINQGVFPAAHPYRRSIGGSDTSVAAITRDQACAFADAHYAPDNAVLVVSGPVTPPELEAALGRFLAKVAPRHAVPPTVVPRVEPAARHSEASAPIGDDALLIAWPLPEDPSLRTRVRAVANATSASIDSAVAGRVDLRELGDLSAPMIAVLVTPSEDEVMADVIREVRGAIADAPKEFTGRGFTELREFLFNMRKQGAIYDLVAAFDDRGNRDTLLAAEVLAGRDPRKIGEGMVTLGTLTRDEAAQITRDYLGVDRAIIVELKAFERVARRRKATLRPPVHDVGQRRDPPDPAAAARPVDGTIVARGDPATTRRTLPNGLNVVLVPSTGVPAVEVRLVFGAGTADEPAAKRGVAMVAGHALTWNLRHLNDMLAFSEAGGELSVDVGLDHTSFAVRGLSMHVDYLLAGLRRLVRDGRYDTNARVVVEALRREAKTTDDEGVLTDAWRAAMFGAEHPYARAGLVRHGSSTLAIEDASAFRAMHYTPANGTLVIAGKFDPVLANQWIDFLFADWKGGGTSPRPAARASLHPASIAVEIELDHPYLAIALPATAGGRAEQLIAAQMLFEIASDVRHQLGATYDMAAVVAEARLATSYRLEGSIDASRLAEAVGLVRARIEGLRTDGDAAARLFVTARKRVLRSLHATPGSAAALADSTQHELVLGREPSSALQLAREVRAMTIDRMAPTLAELDLAGAVVLMSGRASQLDQAFAVLGRTPTRIRIDPDDDDTPTAQTSRPSHDDDDADDDEQTLRPSDITDALTDQPPPARLALAFMPAYSIAASISTRTNVDVSGYSISGAIGYRLTHSSALGVRLSLGSLEGTHDVGTRLVPDLRPIAVLPVSIGAFAQGTVHGRVFGGADVTLHRARITDDQSEPTWQVGVGVGVDLGVDIVHMDLNRLGLFARVETQLGPETIVPMFSLGVAYRR